MFKDNSKHVFRFNFLSKLIIAKWSVYKTTPEKSDDIMVVWEK